MPQAPVDNNGTSLFYTDSGPVAGSTDYTTLVIFHGAFFNGNTFHKLLPFGQKDNIRLVIVNRRDYDGSTKYSDDNLKELNEGKMTCLGRLGSEVAHLLLWFAETHKIPKINTSRSSGGFSVMGWSLGASTQLSLLGCPEVIGTETYTKLEPYCRQLILYDPPLAAMGYDDMPLEGYNPFADPDLHSAEEIAVNFRYWVSSYYNHPDLASRSIHGLNFDKRGQLPDSNDPKSTGRIPSIDNITEEELKSCFDTVAGTRTEIPMLAPPMQPTLKIMAEKALFDEKLAGQVLPKMDIVHIWCSRSQWHCLYGMIETERKYKDHLMGGYKLRPIRFIELEGANHFAHWDDPKDFWVTISGVINNEDSLSI